MPALPIQIGGEFFRELRENACCYVDKTAMIEEFLEFMPPKVSIITRPRRFGKTLTMTMLRDFFDIQQDSRSIFEGLAITQNRQLCDRWMNQYPTLFLSFKEIEGLSFTEALSACANIIGTACARNSFLHDSPHVDRRDRDALYMLESSEEKTLLTRSLQILSRALCAHYGKPVILLIDEYDVPLASAQMNGYYREMVGFLRNMLGAVLKTNESLMFAVLTGCLRISKESIFTGLNNFKCFGISDIDFSDRFGFTQQEVDALLAATEFPEKRDEMREWYDGYRFGGNTEIYCPWDIMQYLRDLQRNPSAKPKAYWLNSSGNSIIRSFVGRTDLNISDKFETLLAGGCVEADIAEGLTYDSLHSSEDNLWSLLYLAGYLTRASEQQAPGSTISPNGEKTPLVIPNREVQHIFIRSISSWFTDSMLSMDRKPLFDAFWKGDCTGFQSMLSRILLTTISYHDYHENFYHAVLTGIFVGSGYSVSSNLESGLGRADIIIKDPKNSRAAVIEVKRAASPAELPALPDIAIRQIRDREYTAPLQGLYESICLWGVAFLGKRCAVKAEGLNDNPPPKQEHPSGTEQPRTDACFFTGRIPHSTCHKLRIRKDEQK